MGLVIARRAVPDEDHISRFVSKNKQERDPESDEFIGLTLAACEIRKDDEGGLSVTWIEHFGEYGKASKRAAAIAYRAGLESQKLPPSGLFAYAQVQQVKSAAADYGKRIKVVWDPVDGNPGHAQVRHFADDDLRLLDLLARQVFSDFDFVADLQLPAPGKRAG